MWHRDWLEEQRTGVPSSRGERYARYTVEQKRAAVDHYLTHGRRASRTIRRLGYPSKALLASWIDELAPGERRVRRGPVPDGLKREVGIARSTYYCPLRAMNKGEIGGAPANLVNRDFHAANPNELWVTDITEFRIPAGKVYLSPVINRHDGMPAARTIGTSPNAALANGMLESACATLKTGETPIIHSDHGCHCRWDEWIRICKSHGLTRSMSAKGCSPDNAAAEGFFGRLKQEFFHKRSFQGVSIDEFVTLLDECMVWYRDKRIKLEYGMSIMDKRIELGLVA